MVSPTGFEPVALSPRTIRSTRLSSGEENGRIGGIRTHGLMHPMHTRYQTTLQSENGGSARTRTGDLFHVKETL